MLPLWLPPPPHPPPPAPQRQRAGQLLVGQPGVAQRVGGAHALGGQALQHEAQQVAGGGGDLGGGRGVWWGGVGDAQPRDLGAERSPLAAIPLAPPPTREKPAGQPCPPLSPTPALPTSRSSGLPKLILSVRMDFHTCCSVQSRTLSQKGKRPAPQGGWGRVRGVAGAPRGRLRHGSSRARTALEKEFKDRKLDKSERKKD